MKPNKPNKQILSIIKAFITIAMMIGLSERALADCKNSTLQVFWDSGLGALQTDNIDACNDALVIVSAGNNYYYVGGQFGYCYGLKSDLSPNQGFVRALSVCLAYVDPITHNVTCFGLTNNAGGNPGVTGYDQIVYAIALTDTGDVYVGGDFSAAANNSYSSNIGCYTHSGGWQSTTIFTVYGSFADTVSGLNYNSTTKKLEVDGTFSWVSGPAQSYPPCNNTTHTLTGLPNQVFWQTSGGNFSCGYWTPH